MRIFRSTLLLVVVVFLLTAYSSDKSANNFSVADTLRYPQEKHLKNVRQLTFGGDNAEAYWSFNSKMLSFQSNNKEWGLACDQIFYAPIDKVDLRKKKPQLISTGLGRTTCAYFMPGDKKILFASTHLGGKDCPKDPERVPGGKYLCQSMIRTIFSFRI
jgi:TolB protein